MQRVFVHRVCRFAAAGIAIAALAWPGFSQTPAAANAYIQHNLVSDVVGLADVTDTNLVNPWGLSASAASPFWVSNHDKGNATVYNGSGAITPLVVAVPPGAKGGASGTPTGQVANSATTSFLLSNGRSASFIFATEDGTISGFGGSSPALLAVDNSAAGAVYKGLAINATGANPVIYAANFNSGKIDVFDAKFAPATLAGAFVDPNLPAGFAPFNIANLGGKLYVTYALQDAKKFNDVAGRGNGFVDVFDLNGNFLSRVVSNGPLNSPWGVAIAPANWGAFSSALLVGNFGDGRINAFDASTGALLGALQDQNGVTIVNQGLWALVLGNGKSGGDVNTVYFTAGISNGDTKTHGLFGALAPPAAVLSVLNGASDLSGAVAPGEIVAVTGGTIGPSPALAAPAPASGIYGTSLTAPGGITSVTFNGTPAALLYASASQTNVIVPYSVTGATANVVVKFRDQTTAAFQVPIAATAPGLFTLDSSGSGQVVAVNLDGTINSPTNAAAKGSPVLLFATGEGPTDPPGLDGTVSGRFFHEPLLTPTLTIGGQNAIVVYAGSGPGLVAGVMEVEAIIPATTASGAIPLVLTAGTASSQKTATISVK
ncbi:MAG TPA: TIGR03118 family protein [Bryobacteraceae bacterium]